MFKRIMLTSLGWLALCLACRATNTVAVDLTIRPETHSFSCRYTLTARSPAALTRLALNLNKQLRVESVSGPHLRAQTARLFYDGFQKDTLRQLTLDFTGARRQQTLTIQYSGQLPKRFYTDSLAELTPYANWLPNLPDREYEPVRYRLTVHVPPAYQVVSTHPPRRTRSGYYEFAGTAPNIEITAIAARYFTRLASAAPGLAVVLYKANQSATAADSLLLRQARRIITYQNQIIGRRDPIRQFTFLLPGTNRNAGGLLDNAAVITYPDFDTRDPAELLILAHEISHKWWGYGTWNDYNNWLNEGFAVYSGLLYLRAAGDTASFRQGLAKRRASAATAPAVLNFDVRQGTYATFRQVMYDKPTIILYELHQRLGDAPFFRILTATAAARISTTQAFLELVERETNRETRDWLALQLST
ncbi:M1 family aminopeptidase [Hymenobacter fastidiosus]